MCVTAPTAAVFTAKVLQSFDALPVTLRSLARNRDDGPILGA